MPSGNVAMNSVASAGLIEVSRNNVTDMTPILDYCPRVISHIAN